MVPHGNMSGLCVECWHGLDCIVKQTLCRVSDTSTVQDVFDLSVVPKLDRELQQCCAAAGSVTSRVSPTGKGD